MESTGLSERALQAWARVSIHLNLGDELSATAQALEATTLTPWGVFGDYIRLVGPKIYATEHLPSGWMWVEPGRRRVLIAQSVMDEFGGHTSLSQFVRGVGRLATEPGFRYFSVEDWRILRATR